MNRLFTLIVCVMVLLPIGADIGALVGYSSNPSWADNLILFFVLVFVVFTDGMSFKRRKGEK